MYKNKIMEFSDYQKSRREIEEFEEKYKMTSVKFYEQYNNKHRIPLTVPIQDAKRWFVACEVYLSCGGLL